MQTCKAPGKEEQIWEAGQLGGGEKASAKLLCHCPSLCSHAAGPHILWGQSSDAGAGRGGIFGKATLLSRCALTPAGLARPGDSGDGRLTSILDAVTEARDSSYCGVREGDGRTLRI